ncbi:MAG TPA: universal stress protein [Blastocatellia bacterium]|nr:universal stress protein [Blastocatellia bacterium]
MPVSMILVSTDFSEYAQAAFETAYDLSVQLGAKLHVLHVQDESNLRVAVREGLLDERQTDEDLCKALEGLTAERFATLLAKVDRSKVAVESLSRRGDSGKVIVDYAREINADMIVIGRRGAGVVRDLLAAVVGSVAESVIRKSSCPVLLVRRDPK